jgi:hypothetical protein
LAAFDRPPVFLVDADVRFVARDRPLAKVDFCDPLLFDLPADVRPPLERFAEVLFEEPVFFLADDERADPVLLLVLLLVPAAAVVLRLAPLLDRLPEPDEAPERLPFVPDTVSAAAPTAPTAAPVAAPARISDATSITFFAIPEVVDF